MFLLMWLFSVDPSVSVSISSTAIQNCTEYYEETEMLS